MVWQRFDIWIHFLFIFHSFFFFLPVCLSYILYPFINHVDWCFPLRWLQSASILSLISPFSKLDKIAWRFHMIVLEVFRLLFSRSLKYHFTSARTHLLSVSLVSCPVQLNIFFRYTAIASSTPLGSRITSLRTCSRNDIPSLYIYIYIYIYIYVCVCVCVCVWFNDKKLFVLINKYLHCSLINVLDSMMNISSIDPIFICEYFRSKLTLWLYENTRRIEINFC